MYNDLYYLIDMEDEIVESIEFSLSELYESPSFKEICSLINETIDDFIENAEELRMQEVRRTGISTPPLFVIKNRQGQEMFFITRKALNEYIKCNKNNLSENKTIIEISSNNSYELEKLIEIIKRNF